MDEVGPLDAATLAVDKAFALPGEALAYTLSLTNVAQSESLAFWVTDTLSSLTDYVPGSVQASTGRVVYTTSVGAGVTGTVWLPQILWAGTLAPGETARLRFGATVRSQSLFDCATIRNVAVMRDATTSLRREVTTRLGEGTLSDLVIQDAAGGQGRPVATRALQLGETLALYAAGYNRCHDYVGPVAVNWQTTGTLAYQTAAGTRFSFTPAVAGGSGRIHADDGQGHAAQTGQITVVHAPPRLLVSPTALYSRQSLGQRFTRALTLSNAGGLTLTYEILPNARMPVYSETVARVYAWDAPFVVDADILGGAGAWDYFFAPEKIDPQLMGARLAVTAVELQVVGMNLAEWINWDWEVHLSDRRIGLPDGQFWASRVTPGAGYTRDAPVQLRLAVGERRDAGSYHYHARHHFVTGATTVTPFFGYVKDSRAGVLSPTDGLHAQAFFWTGDPRATLQFDDARLVVRGVMTRTWSSADWLAVTPLSGTLAPGEVQVLSAVFDARGQAFGVHGTAVTIRRHDPVQPAVMIPATLTVVERARLYLPLVVRREPDAR
jgi:uncharacterized repeat protein (TIGR01451 family)